jgi:FlaA1/EpsC-like NDP-sugar epimerase
LAGEERKKTIAKLLQTVRIRLLMLPRQVKMASMVLYDAGSYWASAVISFWAVFGTVRFTPEVIAISLLAVIIAVPVQWVFGLYASIVRYTGLSLLVVGLRTTFLITVALMTVSSLAGLSSAPIRVGIVFWAFSLILIVGGRVAARMFLSRSNADREPVIIYGAGQAGAQLINALFDGDDYLPVAIVDDNPKLHSQRIHELKVYPPIELGQLIKTAAAKRILLAMPRSGL